MHNSNFDDLDLIVNLTRKHERTVSDSYRDRTLFLRDPNDDYLIHACREHRIDMLVTGDKDGLAHADEEQFAILTPAAFIAVLNALENA